jgi:hypothetical protein
VLLSLSVAASLVNYVLERVRDKHMKSNRAIAIRIAEADVLNYAADVLALKHAQGLFGADAAVYTRLAQNHREPKLPKLGDVALILSLGAVAADRVLFVGVQPLQRFGYAEIREFGRKVLASLVDEKISHLALTIHGPGFGLDEIESFKSELAGIIAAVSDGDFPQTLNSISIVEKSHSRATRLIAVLQELVPSGFLRIDNQGAMVSLGDTTQDTLRSAGDGSIAKPHIFVAMPFVPEMDDVFHYGIQGAANAAGLLCERADLATFSGDIMQWVKDRIANAEMIVADLSSANPNVYLEVGYAWGCNIPTVLIVRDVNDLKFDVRGQRCVVYKSIKELEASLARELPGVLKNKSLSGA